MAVQCAAENADDDECDADLKNVVRTVVYTCVCVYWCTGLWVYLIDVMCV